MGGKTKTKSTPLPSVLSSIRRAGTIVTNVVGSPDNNTNATSTAAERESFLSAISTADGPIPIPQHLQQTQQHHRTKFKAPFELTASGDIGFRGKDKKDATGKKFRVQIPQKMLFYVALVFFVIPILCAIIVLLRKIIGEEAGSNNGHHGVVEKMVHEQQQQQQQDAPLFEGGLDVGEGVEMDPDLLQVGQKDNEQAPLNGVKEELMDGLVPIQPPPQQANMNEEDLSSLSNSPIAEETTEGKDQNEIDDETTTITNENTNEAPNEEDEQNIQEMENVANQKGENQQIKEEEEGEMANPSQSYASQDSPNKGTDVGAKNKVIGATTEGGTETLAVTTNDEEEDEKQRRRMLSIKFNLGGETVDNYSKLERAIEQKQGKKKMAHMLRGGYLTHR